MKQESVSDSRGVFLVKLLGQMKRKEKEEEKRKVSTYSKASLYLFDPCGQAVTHLLPPILFSALQEIPFYVLRITSVLFVKHYATSQKVAGSISNGVIGIFH